MRINGYEMFLQRDQCIVKASLTIVHIMKISRDFKHRFCMEGQ